MRCSHCRTPKRNDCFSGRHARTKTSHRLCNSCVGNGIKKPRFRRRIMAKIGCTIVDIDDDVGAKSMVNFSTTVCNCDSDHGAMVVSPAMSPPPSPFGSAASASSANMTDTDDESSTTLSFSDEYEVFRSPTATPTATPSATRVDTPITPTATPSATRVDTPTTPTTATPTATEPTASSHRLDQATSSPRSTLCKATIEQLEHNLRQGHSIKDQVDSLQIDMAFMNPQPGQNQVLVNGAVQVKTGSRQQSVSVTWDFAKGFAGRLAQLCPGLTPDEIETLASEALFRATRPVELKVRLMDGDTPSPTITTGRRRLTERERGQCWHNAYGDNLLGKCPGCSTMLSWDGSWHAAHLISNANGGETSVANTTPSCPRCNDAMGSNNAPPSFYRQHEPTQWRGKAVNKVP